MKRTIVILSMIALALSSVFGYSWVTSQTKLTNANAHTLTARYLGGTLSCTAGGLDLGSPSYDTGETSYTASGEPDTSYTLAWVTSSGSVTPSSYQWYKDGSAIVGATSSSYTVNESEAADYVFACKAVANGVEYECNVQLSVGAAGPAGPVNYVGGTIFYIDENATGTYTFKNALGATVAAPSVGDDCTGWTYTVSGGNGKDKYYVADLSDYTYLNRQYDGTYYIVWATSGEDLSSYSASIDVLSSTNSTVGTGKRNSDWIKTNKGSSNVYYPKTLGGTANRISIWEIRDEANAAEANGCSDWYCPSVGELTQLRNASGTLQEWHDAVKYGSNAISYVWASSAYSNSDYAWYWRAYPGSDGDYANDNTTLSTRYNANNYFACVLVRSF